MPPTAKKMPAKKVPAAKKAASSTSESTPVDAASSKQQEPRSGELVTFTYDDAAGNPIERTGLVVRTTDEHDPGGPKGAIVAWLADFSDPIPFDQLARVR